MITAQDLTRYYGEQIAIDRVSFTAERGEVVGLLGPNGAGKTTTMRILTGFLPANAGTATVAGFDVFTQSVDVRRRLGYLPEHVPLPGELRAGEYLHYRARLKGVPRRERQRHVSDTAERCRLEPARLRQRIDSLSKGYRQRVGLVDALLGDPPVLILDEPTVGLDPAQMIQTRDLIAELRRRRTVILSTHLLSEAEAVCDRVLIMQQGRIVPRQTVDRLLGRKTIVLEVKGEGTVLRPLLQGIRGVDGVEPLDAPEGRCRMELAVSTDDDTADLREAIHHVCVAAKLPVLELYCRQSSLESLFVKVTTDPLALDRELNA